MYDAIFMTPWPWWAAGSAIGLIVILLAGVTGKALGVSTAYGSLCALGSRAPFFAAREYHEGWRLAFVLGIPLGGFLAATLGGGWMPTVAYGQLDALTGHSLGVKAGLLFGGGLLVGAGARWAGGCPSGHSIAGIPQGSVTSLVATLGFMLGGFALFNLLYAVFGG